MQNEKYLEMYNLYQEGNSLSQVGKVYGMTRQSVYIGFKRRCYKLRKKKELDYQIFDGVKFTLRNTGYLGKSFGDRQNMHRYVWEYHNGEIPKNHDIHHIDQERTNNNIKNLELYTKAEHAKKFATGNNQYGKNNR